MASFLLSISPDEIDDISDKFSAGTMMELAGKPFGHYLWRWDPCLPISIARGLHSNVEHGAVPYPYSSGLRSST